MRGSESENESIKDDDDESDCDSVEEVPYIPIRADLPKRQVLFRYTFLYLWFNPFIFVFLQYIQLYLLLWFFQIGG